MIEDFESLVKIGERLDRTGFGDIRLIQDPGEFCYGIDAVILSDFAACGGGRFSREEVLKKNKKGALIADLGTGTGIIPLILSHKMPSPKVIAGLEVQKDSADRAERSVKLNGLEDRIIIVRGDVSDPGSAEELKRAAGCRNFDIVTMNPPYIEQGRGLKGNDGKKTIARYETTGTLDDFIRTASAILRPKGGLYMVHRPSRLTDIIETCIKYRIEPKTMRLVSPAKDDEPNILLFHGVYLGGRELKIRKPLAVYGEDGRYTDEINDIYER